MLGWKPFKSQSMLQYQKKLDFLETEWFQRKKCVESNKFHQKPFDCQKDFSINSLSQFIWKIILINDNLTCLIFPQEILTNKGWQSYINEEFSGCENSKCEENQIQTYQVLKHVFKLKVEKYIYRRKFHFLFQLDGKIINVKIYFQGLIEYNQQTNSCIPQIDVNFISSQCGNKRLENESNHV